MKSCCDRYSFGVTIATIYIMISVIVFILNCIIYVQNNERKNSEYNNYLKSEALEAMITSAITALISSIFILAIVKRFQYLLLPWLILIIYIFYFSCNTLYWRFIGAAMGGASCEVFLLLLLITLIAFGSQIAIFCFSCSLLKKICNEKIIKKTGSASDVY
ncbi:uncharacterized protein ACRADG_010792 [Cochliomyia hominivorax]